MLAIGAFADEKAVPAAKQLLTNLPEVMVVALREYDYLGAALQKQRDGERRS